MSDFLTTVKGIYTPGTIFKSAQTGGDFEVGPNPIFIEWGDSVYLDHSAKFENKKTYDSSPFVYYSGRWAEIIKQGQPIRKETKVKKTQKISRENLQEIHKIVCPNWQKAIKLKLSAEENLFSEIIEVDEEDLKIGLSEANPFQIDTILKYFNKPEEPKRLSGFYISPSSLIKEARDAEDSTVNANIFATEKQAKSALAYSQLTQLMKEVNGDWVPDWTSEGQKKYIIHMNSDKIQKTWVYNTHSFLAFKSENTRNRFLTDNEELIKTYFEL